MTHSRSVYAAALPILLAISLGGAACSRKDRGRPIRRYVATDAAPARGCGIARVAPRGVKHPVAGRDVYVWGPSSYDGSHPYPVVLTLHGWNGNGKDFQQWFEMEKYVDDAAIVVYPTARGGVWDFHGDTDLDFIAEVLDQVAETYCADRSRVLAFGFSFGSKMAQHLGCKRPDLVKAVAAGAGSWAEKTPTCVTPVPVIDVHRTRDDNETIDGAKDAVKRWAAFDKCSSDTEPSELGHNCVKHRGCAIPGGVTFCEDTHYDPSWKRSWNHTVREEYRALVWRWFDGL